MRYSIIQAGGTALIISATALSGISVARAARLGYVQADCPTLIQQALTTVSTQCNKAGRGKVCYGNPSIAADLQPGAVPATFAAPGDTLDVTQVSRLTLSALNATNNQWGVAELKIKADLPDTDAAQFVTMVLFGDTQLSAASAAGSNSTATATVTPSPTPDSPTSSTPAVDSSAFYFQSGQTSAACAQAPSDGLLIQSPQGSKQRATLSINGATISLGSTVYITAQASGFLTVNTLEGDALVTANGKTASAVGGTAVQVPLDKTLRVSGAPALITHIFYSARTIANMPLVLLPETIVPTVGVTDDARLLDAALTVKANPANTSCVSTGSANNMPASSVIVDDVAGKMWLAASGGSYVLDKKADGSYQATQSIAIFSPADGTFLYYESGTMVIQFQDKMHFFGTIILNYPPGNCASQSATFTGSATISVVWSQVVASLPSPVQDASSAPTVVHPPPPNGKGPGDNDGSDNPDGPKPPKVKQDNGKGNGGQPGNGKGHGKH